MQADPTSPRTIMDIFVQFFLNASSQSAPVSPTRLAANATVASNIHEKESVWSSWTAEQLALQPAA